MTDLFEKPAGTQMCERQRDYLVFVSFISRATSGALDTRDRARFANNTPSTRKGSSPKQRSRKLTSVFKREIILESASARAVSGLHLDNGEYWPSKDLYKLLNPRARDT